MYSMSLQQGYMEMLDRWEWHQFTTNTFRDDVHLEKANKLWELWINMMNRELYGPRWYKHGKALYWCRTTERQQRGTLHFHGLIGGEGAAQLDPRRWTDEWFRLAGMAHMQQPESQIAVQHYVTKHIAWGAEIDFGGPLSQALLKTNYKERRDLLV